jgi:predicted AAA+ superfamily ATPase
MIKRTQFAKLQAHLSKKEITLIIGPRQIGKSTLMELLREGLEKEVEGTRVSLIPYYKLLSLELG